MKEIIAEYIRTALGIDDQETIDMLYNDFVPLVEKYLQEMEAALAQHDAEALRCSAHALKGCAGNIGAKEIQKNCLTVEMAAKGSDFSVCPAPMQELRKLQKEL